MKTSDAPLPHRPRIHEATGADHEARSILERQTGALEILLGEGVIATCFSAYGGLATGPGGVGVPAFAVPNPKPRFQVRPSNFPPFLAHISDEEFARLVGAPMPSESISSIPLDESEEREGE